MSGHGEAVELEGVLAAFLLGARFGLGVAVAIDGAGVDRVAAGLEAGELDAP